MAGYRGYFRKKGHFIIPGSLKRQECRIKADSQLTEYDRYIFTRKEGVLCYGEGMLTVVFSAYFFYRSAVFILFLLWMLPLTVKGKREELCRKRRHLLCMQFREAVISMVTNMQAGYSVENAVKNSLGDMRQLYGEKSDMVEELKVLVKAVDNNIPLENSFRDLGKRSGIKHIQDFADVFVICKRSGGDMTEIMMNTVTVIADGIDVEREIETVISSKKLETKIMNLIPFAIVGYIGLTSPGFFDPLYHNLMGIAVMSACLLIYLFSLYLEKKLMKIEV